MIEGPARPIAHTCRGAQGNEKSCGGAHGACGGSCVFGPDLRRYMRSVRAMRPRERASWLFTQGLLAGFTSAPVLLQWYIYIF